MRRLLLLSSSGLRSTSRDRAAMFFTFLLPLMFLVLFSAIFDSPGLSRATVEVVGSGPLVAPLESSATLEVHRAVDAEAAIDAVRNGDAAAAIIVSAAGLDVRLAASDPVRAGVVRGTVQSVLGAANLQAAGVTTPAFTLTTSAVEDARLSGVDFYVPGILGYSIAASGVFGMSIALVLWRTSGLLRRLRLSPATPGDLVGSRVVVSLVNALVQTLLFLAVGLAFGLHLSSGAVVRLIPLTVIGALSFLGIGVLVGALSKTEQAATALGNLIVLPISFLSGAWFPVDDAPRWMQVLSRVLPMRYLIDALRDVAVRGQTLADVTPEIAYMLAFTVIVGGISLRVFRWDRD